MHILAINQFYAPDLSATAQLLTDLCEDLVRVGDRVTVVASRGTYLGGDRLPARETLRGVEVRRPWATSLGKRTAADRLTDYATFGASALWEVARVARPDVLLTLTTPPMIAAGAAVVARARKVPLVTWIQDVYPEVAVAFGVLPPAHLATRALKFAARASHRAATLGVVLSDGMAERVVAQGQPRARLRVIPNWADGAWLTPVAPEDNTFRREHGLVDRFVAMYSGNLGAGHELQPFIEVARSVERSRPELAFVFVGDGVRRAAAERSARGLTNVRFLPYQSRERLAESLSAADLHLASLQEGLAGLLVPSKLYGILAVGRPLLYLGPATCEVSQVIARDDLGWQVRPGDVDGIVKALLAAASDRPATSAKGARARAVFLQRYDRPHALLRWRSVLTEAVSGKAQRDSFPVPG